MKKMIKKDYVFPYELGDGASKCAVWEGDELSMIFFRYYTDENTPNMIKVRFHGVEWIRSTCLNKYPCNDDEWDDCYYDPQKPIEEYLLLEREWFNSDYEEFMSGNFSGLNTVRCLDDNVVFIDDRIIFSCNQIEIVKAEAVVDVIGTMESALEIFEKRRDDKNTVKKR